MARQRRTNKNDSRQAALFFEDDEVQTEVQETEDAMPDIEVILPEKKAEQPAEVPRADEAPVVRRRKLRFMSFGSGSSGN